MKIQNKNSDVNFGYKACLNERAFMLLSKEVKSPLSAKSLKILNDIESSFDSFNLKLHEREGIPNLNSGRLVIDDVIVSSSGDRIAYGFSPENLPDEVQKYIEEDIEFHPKRYYVSIKNVEYNKTEHPFENALNLMFKKIKSEIDKYAKIQEKLKNISDKHLNK